ncbi:hypothetical protein [Nocardia sp. CA-290969]|uniref:hypothetical protein n=1 Tax=Nocardia sp. CA-290969 TaxID=3239986 RepID=UPI003D9095BA
MGIFDLDFSGADAGSLIGGAVAGGFLGPPGAFLGAMAGSFLGATLVDDKDTGDAVEEALVAGIGGVGGAWGANLAGKLVKEGVEKGLAKAADTGIAGAVKRHVDHKAGLVLVHGPKREGGVLAALGGGFGAYAVSPQSPQIVSIDTTDIGNGGCPAAMSNLQMPADLTGAGAVGEMYLSLPGYLCSVWKSFGTGERTAPPAPELPESASGAETAGVPDYSKKAQRLNTVMAGFAELDAKALTLIAAGADRVSDEGQLAVDSLIETVNTRAGAAPPPGTPVPMHALDVLNEAFGRGREILSQAVAANDRIAGDVRSITAELDALRKQFDEHMAQHPSATVPSHPGGTPRYPGGEAPQYPDAPGGTSQYPGGEAPQYPGLPGGTSQNPGGAAPQYPRDPGATSRYPESGSVVSRYPGMSLGAPERFPGARVPGSAAENGRPGNAPDQPGRLTTRGTDGSASPGLSTTPWTSRAGTWRSENGAADPRQSGPVAGPVVPPPVSPRASVAPSVDATSEAGMRGAPSASMAAGATSAAGVTSAAGATSAGAVPAAGPMSAGAVPAAAANSAGAVPATTVPGRTPWTDTAAHSARAVRTADQVVRG